MYIWCDGYSLEKVFKASIVFKKNDHDSEICFVDQFFPQVLALGQKIFLYSRGNSCGYNILGSKILI